MKSTKYINKFFTHIPDVALNSPINIENLPLPFVHYPNHYGTFISYSLDENSEQYFCSCSENSIRNLLKLHKYLYGDSIFKDINNIGDFFCNKISNKLKRNFENKKTYFYDNFKFIKNLCHKCNNKTPNLRWCHEMYGGNFKQYYGWYIKQTQFDLGFNEYDFLYKECPSDVIEKIILAKQFEDRYIFINELGKNHMNELEKKYAEKCHKELKNISENITRVNFGFKKIGEGLVSETILFNIVSSIYKDCVIHRNIRPVWLERLEIDIYLPDKKLAIEYQGKQHFMPIEAWGGEDALARQKNRDIKKKELCSKHGINLIEVIYDEPLTESFILEKLNKNDLL